MAPAVLPSNGTTDKATRAARIRAHAVFDLIWKRRLLKRHRAYAWMRTTLRLSHSATHISRLSIEQCGQLIQCVYRDFPTLQTRYSRLSFDEDL